MKIGEALRLIRVLNDLTQKQLADRLDISDSYVSEVERGNREPSLAIIKKYSDEFKLPVSSIIMFAESVADKDGETSDARSMMSDRLLRFMRFAAGDREDKT